MAITAATTITVTLTGDVVGTFTIPQDSSASSPGRRDSIALANGNNTITPPAGTTKALIVPPNPSAVTKTLKGVAGDTGIPLATAVPTLISLASAAAFVITTNNTETIQVFWL